MKILLGGVDRHIYAQGDLDGACFLYSVVNAYWALTGREPDFYRVCAALAQVDCPRDFLSGNTGTGGGLAGDSAAIRGNALRVLNALGPERFDVMALAGDIAGRAEELITRHSVLALHYRGDSGLMRDFNHWALAVACARPHRTLHLACSVILQKTCFRNACAYEETFHADFGRWSNDTLSDLHPYELVEGEAFRIVLL